MVVKVAVLLDLIRFGVVIPLYKFYGHANVTCLKGWRYILL